MEHHQAVWKLKAAMNAKSQQQEEYATERQPKSKLPILGASQERLFLASNVMLSCVVFIYAKANQQKISRAVLCHQHHRT